MKKFIAFVSAVVLLCAAVGTCFAVSNPCSHTRDITVTEHYVWKDEPVYSGSCYYQSGGHVHIHEFYKVTVTATCNKCGKSRTETYTVNIRTYCPCGPH
ncbi:MAG: hypothetical protein J6Y48_02385 [Clostridia bacterium]|nr:hypothetical protein [Clostridia bacterium]